MSNALAIAAVTATLEYCLNLVYNHPSAVLGGVSVSALAPDIAQTNFATGSSSQLHVNLFLHQVSPNAAWRNAGLPSLAADGSTRLKNPPLALDRLPADRLRLRGHAGGGAARFCSPDAARKRRPAAKPNQHRARQSAFDKSAGRRAGFVGFGRADRDDQDHSLNPGPRRTGVALDGVES